MPPLPPSSQELLIRLDERTRGIADDLSEMKIQIAASPETFVSKSEFAPVRAIVFGGVALVLVAFMGTLIYIAGWHN